jgi:hypothetical protein
VNGICRDITNYMTTAAFTCLNHAADNRERWLSRFYEIGKEAVRPRKAGEAAALIIDIRPLTGVLLEMLDRAGVGYDVTGPFVVRGRQFEEGSAVVRLDQPYSMFAKALLESQRYPDLKDHHGNPIPPYDVTAHSLNLLTDTKVDVVTGPNAIRYRTLSAVTESQRRSEKTPTSSPFRLIYKSQVPSIDEGWTRWVIERYYWMASNDRPAPELAYSNVVNETIRAGIQDTTKVIIFPDQSPNQILNGYAKGTMPDEYVGGVGKEGVANLKKFVENGGTLVFLNRASNFAIEQFNLPVKDVTRGLARKDFYIPGSILRTELDTTHPIAKGMPQQSIAWFENGPAFEVGQAVSLSPSENLGRRSGTD